ncbi:MAG: YciI family protein [Oceanicaulis sp.]
MKYVLLLHDVEARWLVMSEAEQGEVFARHMAYTDALVKAGAMVAGEPLEPAASAKIVRDGKVQDGPFADSKEQLGGFYVIEAASEAEAIDWAKRCPSLPGGAVEVRPVPDYGG